MSRTFALEHKTAFLGEERGPQAERIRPGVQEHSKSYHCYAARVPQSKMRIYVKNDFTRTNLFGLGRAREA